jgi:hypothetical protein
MIRDCIFQGKVVLLFLKGPPEGFTGGIAVLNPSIEEREGRKFVVGRVPPSPDDWTSGLRVGIAFDQIAHYLEFADENEFFEKSGLAMSSMETSPLQ